MPNLASPLLIEQADALTLAMEIRRAADQAIRAGAKGAALEANFEDNMRPVLQNAARRMGVEIDLAAQVAIIGAGSKGGIGKADLVFSNVILELKSPGIFRRAAPCKFDVPRVSRSKIAAPALPDRLAPGNQEAITELTRYIVGRAREQYGQDWRAHLGDYAGVGLDGLHMFFIRYLSPLDVFDVSEATPISETEYYPVHRLLVLMRSARKRSLNAASLAADFAMVEQGQTKVVSPLAKDIIRLFYAQIVDAMRQTGTSGAPVRARYAEWRKLFREVVSFENKEARSRFGDLQKLYAIPGRADQFDVAAFFFALSTYYGLLVKLLAAEQLVNYCCSTVTTTLENLSGFEPDTLRQYLYDMEREGGNFARFHIRNLLEGELFDWYVEPSVWDKPLGCAVRAMVGKLAEYEIATFDLRPEETRDLLKDLYQHLFPQQVRHALGEYYTPDWLAEFTLDEVSKFSGYSGAPHVRLLDPACGSGTFLVEAIKRARAWAMEHELNPDEARALITRNIVGFDLNPLAVLTARTNYIIALGDLIRGREGLLALDKPIAIPVYLTDSIMIPARPQQAGLEELGGVYKVDLEALKELRPHSPRDQLLLIPSPVVDGGKLAELADLVREGLNRGWDSCRFRVEADTRLNLSDLYQQQLGGDSLPTAEIGRGQTLLAKLYDDMLELHQRGLDGLWGRFLLNRFAPILEVKTRGGFDLIVGNPPWVNWESLPDDYRDAQQPVWKEYGLFKLAGSGVKGTSVRHGAGKKDLSMLMMVVSIDKLLKDGGHLAFIITQTIFKTEAGEGLRKFFIPQTQTFFAPLRVHDMSGLQPFEGATNRTAVMVVRKGQQVKYPVEYVLWKADKPVCPSDTLKQVNRKTTRRKLAAEPTNKAQSGFKTDRWLTAGRDAIRALRKFTGGVLQVYQAYEGSNTGGANGVYWLAIEGPAGKKHVFVTNYTRGAKRQVRQYTGYKIETELLYPLLRGRDVNRWSATPSLHILVAQDPQTRMGYKEEWLRDVAPLTYQWLAQFQKELLERAAFKKYFGNKQAAEFWTMYNIGSYTFAPFKVVWSEIAHTLKAAVVGSVEDEHLGKRIVMPDHTVVFIPARDENEAHYVCALLNSTPAQLAATAYIVLHPDPHILTRIALPKFDPHSETHKALAAASKAAHKAAAKGKTEQVMEAEEKIDCLAARVWNLTDEEMQDIKDSLRDLGGVIGYEEAEDEDE